MLRCAAVAAVTAVIVALVVRAGRRPRAQVPEVEAPKPSPEPQPAASRFRPPRRWVATLAVALLAAVGGIAAIIATRPNGAACLSKPGMMPDTAGEYVSGMPRPLTIEDLPAPGTVIKLGDAMEIPESDEMQHDLSVRGAKGLETTSKLRATDGRRLVSVLVRERNTGQMTIIPQGDDQAWLCDADGTWYQHDAALTALLAEAGSDRLEPGRQVDQRVVFQLRAGARPSRVRIVQHAYRWTKTADWKLG
ncbi:hypothetical protein Ate02nite_07150 [Paractinoplanes tereljensis]|uniref:DUF4352 domain-containing protein n=1 Tax=Paractinoplanes tereljensis TaxID=571912 RepID=A0A919NH07_9ACTN|nr:hypothetical protein Ate02nite_07150 [Actinoplanes tereljensis]